MFMYRYLVISSVCPDRVNATEPDKMEFRLGFLGVDGISAFKFNENFEV